MSPPHVSDEDWALAGADLDDGEWFRWDRQTRDDRPDIAEAVAEFDAHSSNAKAAAAANAWFCNEALDEAACVTRVLLVEGRIASFYGLASGEVRLTSTKKLERMGIMGGSRVGSSHVEWVARDRRSPPGAGVLAVKHAIYVAYVIADLQGNRALTMDPFDKETEAMWRDKGFHRSQTELDDGLRRLYLPLYGAYYGSFDRPDA